MAELFCTGCGHKLADHVKHKRIEGRSPRVVYRCIGAVATSGHCACTGYSGPVVDQWKERALAAEALLSRLLTAQVINFPDDAPGADEAWSMGYEHGLYATRCLHLTADEVALVRRLQKDVV